jgi:PTH1 family peptidyl-tRNA hydrolase
MTEDQRPFLIAGLGNPGREYRNSRHNIGFSVLDALCEEFGLSFSRMESNAMLVKHIHEGKRLLLAKPQTFMNSSGQSVSALARFYRIENDQILIVSDDLDLPLGKIRLRPGGGSGGHKGLQSIIQHLGSDQFPRLRIGIGRPNTPQDPADYVLQPFYDSEQEELEIILKESIDCILAFLKDGVDTAMNRYNAGQTSNDSE